MALRYGLALGGGARARPPPGGFEAAGTKISTWIDYVITRNGMSNPCRYMDKVLLNVIFLISNTINLHNIFRLVNLLYIII